jgi:hypothetical protein
MQSIQFSTHSQKDNFLELEEKNQFLGVQYLRNCLGQKTAVLSDLKEHGDLWANVEEEIDIPVTIQFLVDEQGGKLMVLLNFEQHGEIWEDIYYSLIACQRDHEPTLPFSEVKKSLIEQGN